VSKDLTPAKANGGDSAEEPPPALALRDVLAEALEAAERIHEEHREITGVPTGFPDLDRLMCGLQAGNLVVIAARPGVGKGPRWP
jgi:replicative DNA helicase